MTSAQIRIRHIKTKVPLETPKQHFYTTRAPWAVVSMLLLRYSGIFDCTACCRICLYWQYYIDISTFAINQLWLPTYDNAILAFTAEGHDNLSLYRSSVSVSTAYNVERTWYIRRVGTEVWENRTLLTRTFCNSPLPGHTCIYTVLYRWNIEI